MMHLLAHIKITEKYHIVHKMPIMLSVTLETIWSTSTTHLLINSTAIHYGSLLRWYNDTTLSLVTESKQTLLRAAIYYV